MKALIFLVLLVGNLPFVVAQKLLQIQQTSIWLENFEANGKLNEWQQPLKAYNNDTHVAYSMANDEIYLYLAVKSNRARKILEGGLMLEIIGADKQSLSVVFPYNVSQDRRGNPNVLQHPDRLHDIQDIKEMELAISTVPETRVPIVNAYGVLAGITQIFEESDVYPHGELYYNIEIAIPLQYISDLSSDHVNPITELDYRIALRGIQDDGRIAQTIVRPTGGGGFSQKLLNAIYEKELDMIRKTFLEGTYRLASKPD